RDLAMIRCMSDLGLRVSEVVALTLDDIDWRRGLLTVRGGKGRRGRTLPLPAPLGRAITAYLHHGRPASADRHVFLRHQAPVAAPVTHTLIRGVFRRAYAAATGRTESVGTHVLRHTAAARMRAAGQSLKGIADVLGHRCLDTTTTYVKLDVEALRGVALPWVGGGMCPANHVEGRTAVKAASARRLARSAGAGSVVRLEIAGRLRPTPKERHMRPTRHALELERRRIRAVELVEQGESPTLVARILGISKAAVSRWRRMAREGLGLAAKPRPGRKPSLSDEQVNQLEQLLLQGAVQHGWLNNLWTCARVAKIIERAFGICYHKGHVSRILRDRLNWSSQRPQRQHPDGNDEAIALWVEEEFPRILSEAASRDAHLAFVDETGFMLNP